MKQEKQLLLDDIRQKMDDTHGLVITSYDKMDANLTADFRSKLYEIGGTYHVIKKRVVVKAAEQLGLKLDLNELKGHVGVFCTGEKFIEATKAFYEFKSSNDEKLTIICGQYDKKLCSANDVLQISKLPTQDEMRAQFLGLLTAPMADTLGTMQALLTSVVYCLENKTQK